MNVRHVLVPALLGALLAGTVSASAATPTLDGKKVKVLTATYTPEAQDHDSDQVTDALGEVPAPVPGATDGDKVSCSTPRCGRLVFVYKPAKRVSGGVMVETTWSLLADDIDLYVAEIAKDGSATKVAGCATTGGTSEKVYLAPGTLRPGKKYAIVTDFFRVVSDTVTTRVSFPGTDTTKAPVPAGVNQFLGVNCGQ
jgi:hypothetical protein